MRPLHIACRQFALTAAGSIVALTGLFASADQVPLSDWRIERVETSRSVHQYESLSIENFHGDIRARGGEAGEFTVHAVIQRHREDQQIPEIVFETGDGQLGAKVIYPGRQGETLPDRFSRRRVDIAVFVPPLSDLSIHTLDDRAESKGQEGNLEVNSRRGPILVVTKGSVDAYSESGDVQVQFKNRIWGGPSRLQTVSGDIFAFLVNDPGVGVSIDTAGTITTDYSIEITPIPGTSRKTARAVIGGGGHELMISSAVGAVRLGRILDFLPAQPPGNTAVPGKPSGAPD